MDTITTSEQLDTLRSYAAGKAGTRTTIERAGFRDYADPVIALVQNDLDFPRPPSTPTHDANLACACDSSATPASWQLISRSSLTPRR